MTEEYEKLVLSVAGKQQRGKGDAQGPPLKADTFSHLATLHARLLAAPQQPRGWRRLSRAWRRSTISAFRASASCSRASSPFRPTATASTATAWRPSTSSRRSPPRWRKATCTPPPPSRSVACPHILLPPPAGDDFGRVLAGWVRCFARGELLWRRRLASHWERRPGVPHSLPRRSLPALDLRKQRGPHAGVSRLSDYPRTTPPSQPRRVSAAGL